MSNKAMITIGASAKAVQEVRKTLLVILNSSNDQATKQEALRTMTEVCSVKHTTISNCTFSNSEVVTD